VSVRRLGTVVLAAMCTVALLAPTLAVAATATHETANAVQATNAPIATSSIKKAPVSGVASNHKRFAGQFTIDRFVTRHGKPYAVGTLTGKLGKRTIKRNNVAMPVKTGSGGIARAAATCPVLHLDLGPLNLNLLGLTIHLNQVVLDVNAVSGPGNLLGNLLCSVAGLLNGPTLTGSQITGLLNILQQLINTPGLLGI
jgi:hypothetical protein